jgi:hypothetical protein
MDFETIKNMVQRVMNETAIVDVHTHLYSEVFGPLMLWGVDELLTYHYLVAEFFRYRPDFSYDAFWNMSKAKQAEAIWDELFVKNSPISEAARGVVTVLHKLGIDITQKNLNTIRKYFADVSISQYIDKVFELANVKTVVMTNDPFDQSEQDVWNKGLHKDERFKASLRLDGLLNDFEKNIAAIKVQGFDVSKKVDKTTKAAVRDFLKTYIEKIKPVYMAVSLPPDFRMDDKLVRTRLIADCVLPIAREYNLPFAMMIGVERSINPALSVAGDGAGKADVGVVAGLCRDYPENKFMVTMLSRENQHELCVTARKFKNLTVFGCWWFLNNPSIIREMTAERIELLGLTAIPQHSDARVLDQLIYKWSHSRKVIADVLTEKYFDLVQAGWNLNEADLRRDMDRLLGGQGIV